MSAVIFFGILILLCVGVWLVAIVSLWYGRELLKRQRELTLMLLPYLKKTAEEKATMQALHIDKNEPLSKYSDVTLPDQVHVAFTDSEKDM